MWKINRKNGGLGQKWSTPNSQEEGKKQEEEEKVEGEEGEEEYIRFKQSKTAINTLTRSIKNRLSYEKRE